MAMYGWYIPKMSGKVKVAGTWRDSTAPYVKVGGNWKIAKSAWSRVNGEWKTWFLQGGLLDNYFTSNVGTGLDLAVNSIAIQSDGKIILGGTFTTLNGATVNRIARLNLDGTSDTTFTTNAGTGASGNVVSIVIQSDDKILLGGEFTTFNGTTVNRIARLNSNGTLDTAFTTNAGTGASGRVNSIAIQSDGKIILGGFFTTLNGTTVYQLARLNSNGTRDTTFSTSASFNIVDAGNSYNRQVLSIAVQSDGKILASATGDALVYSSQDDFFYFVRTAAMGRLQQDGTLDSAFNKNNNFVNLISLQQDSKIIIIASEYVIFRLNSDGTTDTAFTANRGTGADSPSGSRKVHAIRIQEDDKIILGGDFITFNGATVNRIARLNSNGTPDTAFTVNTGTGANATVGSIAVQSDKKILLGGNFTTFNSQAANRTIRIGGENAG
jgi:uncharacterized delta-60 repeat protein